MSSRLRQDMLDAIDFLPCGHTEVIECGWREWKCKKCGERFYPESAAKAWKKENEDELEEYRLRLIAERNPDEIS